MQPAGVWHAPGRVNFIGEHTDYNGGFALPFAIGAGVFVAAAARDDGLVALSSRRYGGAAVTVPVTALGTRVASTAGPRIRQAWCWALRSAGYQVGGVSLAVDADLPAGAGLSSSAALTSAAGLAVSDLYRLTLPRTELAVIGPPGRERLRRSADRDHGSACRAAGRRRSGSPARLPGRERDSRAA